MFGFYSFLPFSTVGIIYYNGKDSELVLNIQRQNINITNIISVISIDLTIEKDKEVIL
jgi:hypothetical protein